MSNSNVIAPDEIHRSVRQHYGNLARTSTSCCGPSTEAGSLYPEDLANALPDDVAGFSLGCGDPITIASLNPGETVVDLGSGGGLDCFLAARQVGPTGHVIGVDMTAEMLAKARANAERLGASNVEFREGYIEHLPLGDGEADVVISNCVINLSPDKPQVFRDVFRVLRPGGRISVSDIVTDGELPEAVQKNMEAWGACVAGALDVKEYVAGLEAAGFVQVKVQPKGSFDPGLSLMPVHEPFSAIITGRKPQAS
ncbi:MAG: arsenite methyltransferase [Chloroflexi bacterium]|nr:arsenite methyltransferase [Chloroflexota bacterium]